MHAILRSVISKNTGGALVAEKVPTLSVSRSSLRSARLGRARLGMTLLYIEQHRNSVTFSVSLYFCIFANTGGVLATEKVPPPSLSRALSLSRVLSLAFSLSLSLLRALSLSLERKPHTLNPNP